MDVCKSQQMYYKAILENNGTLESVLDCCKNQEMCNRVVDDCPDALEFVPDCHVT